MYAFGRFTGQPGIGVHYVVAGNPARSVQKVKHSELYYKDLALFTPLFNCSVIMCYGMLQIRTVMIVQIVVQTRVMNRMFLQLSLVLG